VRRIVAIANLAVIAAFALPTAVASQAVDRWIGTWTLDLAQSKYIPGPPPQGSTITIEPVAGGGQKYMVQLVNTAGGKMLTERVAKFDGTDVSVRLVGDTPPAEAASITETFRRIDDHSFEMLAKRDGNVRTTAVAVVSPDGKTLTYTTTGTSTQGQPLKNVTVYRKQ